MDKLEHYVQQAMNTIPEKGMGQLALRESLGLDDDGFQELKNELLHRELVSVYRARGGGIRPVVSEHSGPDVNIAEIERASDEEEQEAMRLLQSSPDERALYPYLERWLLNSTKYGFTSARTIGDNHRRRSWDNPDLIAWNVYDFEWLVGREIELTAVEAKLSFNIYGIWQAANYRRFAHRVFLACYADSEAIYTKEDGRLLEAAAHLGLGLIALTPAGAGGVGMKCTELLSPILQNPTSIELDSFISDFSDFFELSLPGKAINLQIAAAMHQ